MVNPKSGSLLRPLGRGRSDGKRWPYTSFALVTFLRGLRAPFGCWGCTFYKQKHPSAWQCTSIISCSEGRWLVGWVCFVVTTRQLIRLQIWEMSLQQILVLLMLIWNLNFFPVILYISSFLSLSSDWLIDKNFLETFLSGKKSHHISQYSRPILVTESLFCFIFQRDGSLKQYGFFRQVFLQHFINFQLRAI